MSDYVNRFLKRCYWVVSRGFFFAPGVHKASRLQTTRPRCWDLLAGWSLSCPEAEWGNVSRYSLGTTTLKDLRCPWIIYLFFSPLFFFLPERLLSLFCTIFLGATPGHWDTGLRYKAGQWVRHWWRHLAVLETVEWMRNIWKKTKEPKMEDIETPTA